MRDLLLELRARPLPARHALFLLCGQTVDEARALPREIVRQLSQLAGSGLVVYDPAAKVLEPSQVLRESHAPPGVAALVDAGSFAAQALILAVGVLYLLVPVDVLPEAALGPLGYLDDLVLLLLASLPLGHTLLSRRPALLRRRFNRPTGS
ncbi:DUF1232 domain-containing protein [bacterium]|nr:DUF1232 domain-containing protein [bacterium]